MAKTPGERRGEEAQERNNDLRSAKPTQQSCTCPPKKKTKQHRPTGEREGQKEGEG
jgi:hypothetical protein